MVGLLNFVTGTVLGDSVLIYSYIHEVRKQM